MKIAILISVIGKVKRGGESTTIGLASYLSKHSDVHIYSGGEFSFDNVTNLGFPQMPVYTFLYKKTFPSLLCRIIRRFHLDPLSIRNIMFCRRAFPLLIKSKPDVVILRSIGPNGIKMARYLRKKFGFPLVTVEGGWKTGEREVSRFNPNLHVSVNMDVAEYLKKQLPNVNICNIPNGLNVKNFDPQGEKASIPLERPIVLSCGYMGDWKRYDLIIHAMAKLEQGSLLLLGRGGLAEELKKLGKELLGERFMLSFINYDEMPKYYRAVDVLTLPSVNEAFGMVYLEAMACNTPVVATRDANRERIVGEGGELVDPTDIDAYAEAIEKCLNKNYGDKPRKQAEKFDWDVVGPQYLNVIKTVIHDNVNQKSFPIFRARYFRR